MPKTTGYRLRDRASGSTSRNAATIQTLAGKGPIMSSLRHLASPIAKSFSEALRIDTEAGSWIFVAGQLGAAIPSCLVG
jgi:hypothetical protein